MLGGRFWMIVSGILAIALLIVLIAQLHEEPERGPVATIDLAQTQDDFGFVYPSYVKPGSTDIFRVATSAAPGHELIVADLLLPANAVGDAHLHPWEEHLYVLEGSAILDVEGMAQRTLQAGESFVIPGETVHTPKAGPDGIRAIIVRVHDEGDPVTVPAGQ